MKIRGLLTAALMVAGVAVTLPAAQIASGVSGFGQTYSVLTKTGWWFRVNTAATIAAKITFRLDSIPQTTTASDWWYHSGGRPSEFSLATRTAPDVALQLLAEPNEAKGSVCVFFKNEGVRLIEFTGQISGPLNSAQQDRRCRPNGD